MSTSFLIYIASLIIFVILSALSVKVTENLDRFK
ncbi:hypothetical protein BTTOUR_35655 [Bacillus thuringiensis serovar toumanoffi]|uniref:Uncharacterized protein n=1 Tax=Bacillus thuringiensis serovar toumanoffi TaxID=180862 RepID=A0ABD5I9T4_BACTU|nr:hypothetical protein [Bacillus thuringiensis serovar toumanoffi]MDW9214089.1 hypothetical protein [Bacillus thuringiensis serovar toumanoffi]